MRKKNIAFSLNTCECDTWCPVKTEKPILSISIVFIYMFCVMTFIRCKLLTMRPTVYDTILSVLLWKSFFYFPPNEIFEHFFCLGRQLASVYPSFYLFYGVPMSFYNSNWFTNNKNVNLYCFDCSCCCFLFTKNLPLKIHSPVVVHSMLFFMFSL